MFKRLRMALLSEVVVCLSPSAISSSQVTFTSKEEKKRLKRIVLRRIEVSFEKIFFRKSVKFFKSSSDH